MRQPSTIRNLTDWSMQGSFRPWSLYPIGPWLIFPMLMSYSLTTNSLTLKRYSKAQILKPELKVQTNSLIYGLIPITWGSYSTIYRVFKKFVQIIDLGFNVHFVVSFFSFWITPYIITMTKKVTQDDRVNITGTRLCYWYPPKNWHTPMSFVITKNSVRTRYNINVHLFSNHAHH